MRTRPSILHLDLDAFFAAVEQRDKPSLRGKPVVVGGLGARGVVSTASYEARAFGARSAMPTVEARHRCPPGTAFLAGRFPAYRRSSTIVREILMEISPLVEPVSLDEAYVDLAAGDALDLSVEGVTQIGERLQAAVAERTGGLTCSVGVASSKLVAKIASDLRKPRGLVVVPPGTEVEFLAPLPVRSIGGVGPVTAARLHALGVETIRQLAEMDQRDLVSLFGQAHGSSLYALARGDDDRAVSAEREAKSISAEETFEVDIADQGVLAAEIASLGRGVVERMTRAGLFARTVTLKLRRPDFSIITRSSTVSQPMGDAGPIIAEAVRLLSGVDTQDGVRLVGVGLSGFAEHSQGLLWVEEEAPRERVPMVTAGARGGPALGRVWRPGADVRHEDFGAGWVWGSGLGRVTVRFEGPNRPNGPVKTFAIDDPALSPADPPDWAAP